MHTYMYMLYEYINNLQEDKELIQKKDTRRPKTNYLLHPVAQSSLIVEVTLAARIPEISTSDDLQIASITCIQ